MTYRSCPDHKLEPMDTCRVCAREAAEADHQSWVARVKAELHASRDTGRTERADDTEETL